LRQRERGRGIEEDRWGKVEAERKRKGKMKGAEWGKVEQKERGRVK
jgi:hypothetical protein